jgi:hypothetical protein
MEQVILGIRAVERGQPLLHQPLDLHRLAAFAAAGDVTQSPFGGPDPELTIDQGADSFTQMAHRVT